MAPPAGNNDMPEVIDLLSSDENDTPPRRDRRTRGKAPADREGSQPAPAILLTPTRPPERAPVQNQPEPAPALGADNGAFGGADLIDLDNLDDLMNYDPYGDMFMPGGWQEHPMPAAAPRAATPPQNGQFIIIDGENVFIPDSPRPDRAVPNQAPRQEPVGQDPIFAQEFTADVCLAQMLTVFPDIDHDYVLKMYEDYAFVPSPGGAGGGRLETMVEKILTGGSYPKKAKVPPARKRKREDDGDEQVLKKWEAPDREIAPAATKGAMASILKADFPEITNTVISKELLKGKHLYQSYLALAKMKDTCDDNKKWTGRAALNLASADTIAANCGWPAMIEELQAAREYVKDIRRMRVIEDAKKWEEKENLKKAIDANETAECQACFDDLPMNRQIHCDGETAHFTCFDCATTYLKSEVGDARCRVLCTAGCGAPFARAQLHLLADKELLEQLEQLQQEKDIRDAGLDDLEECPFCDYKAILPPIEEDFEFRCANEDCEKVSCRRCKAVSHIPMSCEEHAKENKLSVRHRIEEAMTAALIRNCAKCKKGFIKEYGCNKMTCPSCGNLQCYVCSESLKGYDHFDHQPRMPGGSKSTKCPLYDNVEERHEREIKEAEAAARQEVINDNPDVSVEDLQIKVSDAVKKATDDRVKRAGAVPGGIPPGYGAGYGGAANGALHAYMPGVVLGGARALAAGLLGGEADGAVERERLRALAQDQLAAIRRLAQQRRALQAAQQDRDREVLRQRNRARPGPARLDPEQPNAGGAPVRANPFPMGLGLHPGAAPPLPGGFNEDPFGGGDNGDPWDLHRLLGIDAPGELPVRPPRPAPPMDPRLPAGMPNNLGQRQPRNAQRPGGPQDPQARLEAAEERLRQVQEAARAQHEARARIRDQHAERIRALEEQEQQALQGFNDRRGGRGEVFHREPQDPGRLHQGGGWPGQN